MRTLLALFFCFICSSGYGQIIYSGRVYDNVTKEPLAFVNVISGDERSGVVSDIDGLFKISSDKEIKIMRFQYIGYQSKQVEVNQGNREKLVIYLEKKPFSLGEFIVKAEENPAHRIIRKVIENREQNNPENLPGFYYQSYNKLVMAVDSLDQLKGKNVPDTAIENAKKFFDSNHLFLSESVTERNYRYKGLSNEKILASRVSGLKSPLFTLLATEFQSFSFYNDYIKVSDKNYLNPITPNSTSKYIFIIEDTSYFGKDTVFQIRFLPREGKNIDGLKGILYINTNQYAIQNVIAEPGRESGNKITITQQYQQINGKWFPVQLNSDMVINTVSVSGRPLKGNARSYLSNIKIGEPLPKKAFSEVEIHVDARATEKDEQFWMQYRKDTLSAKDKKTYHVIDSLGKEAKLEEKVKTFNSFLTGRYPIGMIDIDLNRIIDYNRHEGYRAGLGLYTNARFSELIFLGGYGAYGFHDEQEKFGGTAGMNLRFIKAGKLSINYINDVTEAGTQGNFLRKKSVLSEDYRRFSVSMMDRHVKQEASFSFRAFKYLHATVNVSKQEREPLYIQNVNYVYHFSETQLLLKYVYREKFLQIGREQFSMGSDQPVIWIGVSKAVNGLFGGEHSYTRFDLMTAGKQIIRNGGTFHYKLKAGYLEGSEELPFLYHMRGANDNWRLYDEESFQTMDENEFFSDRYVAAFIRHDFGKLLIRKKFFHPSLAVVSAAGLFNQAPLDKPYLESGLQLNDLINVSVMKLGFGAYYRYGYHTLPDQKKNLTFKLSLFYAL